ncbi:cytochrome o ubiquinol oxidase, subunit II [Bradyrhizobium sp. STM 3843]|uniref:cytochrome o ubiquinol oxidase subunit II n=1 Tax=Bradyrhizobium sp. STM 3843 TaxID=551947 RepID=UPI0002403CCA|nr:cytochrome o ubiquinol oxidase subunit II [Bradyrhizobium sp. STM 3843]CCE08501.1 cytochrome o ubiquinol oxidase, subunit II [Bradyrhizobium sp. STM 3843]
MNIFDPQGPIAAAEKTLLIDSVAIMLAIIIPTIIAILIFAFWYRASNSRAEHLPNFAYSGRIEMVVWSIPALTIILLGGVAWIGSHQLDPGNPVAGTGAPIRIQVVSLDWKWLFLYPDQRIATVNHLTVPVGSPLHLELTSGSVMTAFFIPQLGSMIYTMNGMVTRLDLRADEEGTFKGLASQFSGDGFPEMMFDTHVVSQVAFSDWAQSAAKSTGVLDETAYKTLAEQSIEKTPKTYRLDDPELFGKIATQKIAPAPGPQMTAREVRPEGGARNVR